jgi:hypothetical protein
MRCIMLAGKSELSIILCLSTGSETCSKQLPVDVQKIVDTYQLNPFTAKASIASSLGKLSFLWFYWALESLAT